MKAGDLNYILKELGDMLKCFPPPAHVGIKINLSSPTSAEAPKTDKELLIPVLDFLVKKGYSVTILEGAKGYLYDNLVQLGLKTFLDNKWVDYIDIDNEKDVSFVEQNGRVYAIPNVLKKFDLRIAVPCATKRPGYLFSCNVKTFVGVLPRCFCQNGEKSVYSRPMIHEDLAVTVSDLFYVIAQNVPFHFFINGGNTISEECKIKMLPEYYLSENAIELDELMVKILQVEEPEYLRRVKALLQGE